MSFLDSITAFLPFGKKEEQLEYFFAVNIGTEKAAAALWCIQNKVLKILDLASLDSPSPHELITVTDRLLDQVIGLKEIEPQKILFGVPHFWVQDDNLKEEHLKTLRHLVKELELIPMAYVAASRALTYFLEHQEGVPTTAILVGFEKSHLTVTVVRAGKLDGAKVVERGENSGSDIEKALLTFTDVETLPSRILIYGVDASQLKTHLLSFSWMTNLSFLHFPKIEVLDPDIEIKSVCLAGASEIQSDVKFIDKSDQKIQLVSRLTTPAVTAGEEEDKDSSKKDEESEEEINEEAGESKEALETDRKENDMVKGEDLGFMTGDVSDHIKEDKEEAEEEDAVVPAEDSVSETLDFEPQPPVRQNREAAVFSKEDMPKKRFNFKKFLPGSFTVFIVLFGIIAISAATAGAYLMLVKAEVKVFVEPKILEKDATVVADPNQKTIDEEGKIIPGSIVETEITGTAKDTASGKRNIGDPAKGTVVIINNTSAGQQFSAGTVLTTSSGVKFKLDNSASVSATLVDADSKSKVTVAVTAFEIGADGNIPSETNLSVGNYPAVQFVGKAQGNFSGGTSKEVTVVSDADQKRLLASLASDLRKQAQQKLQEKLSGQKILEEALSETIVSKNYNKNINDAAGEFSLNLKVRYKGTAFKDEDLKLIVSKLVNTQVPEGFSLDISETETQADVSKLEKDGKLVFLAKFKAKMLPKIDAEKIKNQISFKTPKEVESMIGGLDNVLGSEIKITPALPKAIERLPVLAKNIKVEVGLK